MISLYTKNTSSNFAGDRKRKMTFYIAASNTKYVVLSMPSKLHR